MNIFSKFTELTMSECEQEIINLIMKDPFAFAEMSVNDIAAKCYVSRATVYRFCEKLGLNGLSDLKV
ncbi:MAG: MurR/RpiR family transcriptional regulator, partial [Solobacterium sp.]|nr:MurR/RpiR family transcriptional regulator [Solobacterium sp.]